MAREEDDKRVGKDVELMKGDRGVRAFFALFLMFTLLLVSGSPSATAAVDVLAKPQQREYIVDTAGMVSEEDRQQITAIGEELRNKTKAEIVVVTVDTLGGADIETYSTEIVRRWGIGDAKLNNGVLLLIAKADRKFRIEVGYGLEGEITDGRAGAILDAMKGAFRQENYSAGILTAYRKLAAHAYRAANTEPSSGVDGALDGAAPSEEEETSILGSVLFFLLAIVGMVLMGVVLYWILDRIDHALGGSSGGSSRRSSGGSGSSGGGFSGRGGYGGGSSGGGGASGGW